MPLKFKFKAKDEIPADVLAHYVERDGACVLDVEGAVDRSRVDDFLGRARNVFKLVNGVPTALDMEGKSVRYGKDGVTPMTLEEWTDAQG